MNRSALRSNPGVYIAAVLLIGAAIGLGYYLLPPAGPHQDPGARTTAEAADPLTATIPVQPAVTTAKLRPAPARTTQRDTLDDSTEATDEPGSTPVEQGELSIAGRILNRRGDPVSGIEIRARRYDPATNRFSSRQNSARSLAGGRYLIEGLAAGDYQLRTTGNDRYTSAAIYVRAGFHSADIVLNDGHQLRVVGTVTDNADYPLAGVEVIPSRGGRSATTDEAGNYELSVLAQRNRTYSIRFQAAGYTDEIGSFVGAEVMGITETRLDARLRPAGNSQVTGMVTNEFGNVVVGARIWINSPSLKTTYRARSDANGFYSISGIKAGSDYQLTATVRGLYERYIRRPVAITDGGSTLDITLRSIAGGRVVGNMVDVLGEPVPSFTLLLTSSKAAGRTVPVVGDDNGYFAVDKVPEGRLTFVTRSQPRVSIRGAELTATSEVFVRLVIDWGVHDLVGRVTDISGNPLPGVDAALTWRHEAGLILSSSSRRTLTDAEGLFRFTQLGPGVHRLDLMANGYQRYNSNVDVSGEAGELSIQLQRDS